MMASKWSVKKTINVYAKTNGRCWYCGEVFDDDHTIDHIVPISRGGTNDLFNLVPACKHCNSQKNTKTLEEYRVYLQGELGMTFTNKQKRWLNLKGIEIPEPDEYLFYFEEIKNE